MTSLLAALLASALVFIQCYISGTRMAFSLPSYMLIALAGILSLVIRRRPASIPDSTDWPARPSWGCFLATAAFFAYILVRATWSPVEYLARPNYYSALACLVVYGLTAIFITGRTQRMAIVWVLLALAVVEVVIGTRQFAYGDNWMPFGLIRSGIPIVTRASGMFNSPIHLAGYLEAVGPFALALAFWGVRKLWVRLLAGYIAAVCYFGIAITGSRGGWISAIFSLFVFVIISLVLLKRTHSSRFAPALYLSIVGALILPVAAITLMQKDRMLSERLDLLGKITTVHQTGYDIRIYNWLAALDQWKESKWIGTGAGTHLYYGRLYRREQLQADPEHAHSDYLELLAEYGVVGFAGMLVFLAVHLRSGVRGFRRLRAERADDPYRPSHELAMNVGALCAFSAYFAHSAVDFNLHLPGNALLFAFIFGLLANPSKPPVAGEERDFPADDSEPPPKGPVIPWWQRLAVPGLSIWLAVSGAPLIPAEILCERARVAQRDGRYEDSIRHATEGLKREKQNPYLYYNLGQAHRLRALRMPKAANRPDLLAAEAAFKKGLEVFPQDEDHWVRLGQTLDALGKYAEARKAYEQAISLDPKHGLLYGYLAEHYLKIGNPDKAEEVRLQGQILTSLDLSTYLNGDLHAPNSPEEQPK